MKVYYKKLIEGTTIPAIIHNGNYYYLNMSVYEDGTIDCYERVALDCISEKLDTDWLVTHVPDGKAISIHGLTALTVANGKWDYTPKSYQQHILDTVKSMNKNMVGIHKDTDEQKAKWEKHRTYWTTYGKPYKIRESLGYGLLDGESASVFLRQNDTYHLVSISGFADDTFLMSSNPNSNDETVTVEKITNLVNCGDIVCAPPKDSVVYLPGLGSFEVADDSLWSADVKEKLKEILELPNRAGSRETAHDRAVRLYHQYLTYPQDWAREQLREAYEAVPEHERMYLGDMDSKDWDYIRILYEPDRKREV